jgi:hypothetical protein
MEGFKIHNICLDKLTERIDEARIGSEVRSDKDGRILLESYNTSDIDEIIRIIGISDLRDRTIEGLLEKLEDLSLTLSCFTQEDLIFAFSEQGDLGLYLSVTKGTP